jgi:hypothetical protein
MSFPMLWYSYTYIPHIRRSPPTSAMSNQQHPNFLSTNTHSMLPLPPCWLHMPWCKHSYGTPGSPDGSWHPGCVIRWGCWINCKEAKALIYRAPYNARYKALKFLSKLAVPCTSSGKLYLLKIEYGIRVHATPLWVATTSWFQARYEAFRVCEIRIPTHHIQGCGARSSDLRVVPPLSTEKVQCRPTQLGTHSCLQTRVCSNWINSSIALQSN